MRLIDADKLRDKFLPVADTGIWCAFCNEVNKAPTVDLEEHDKQVRADMIDVVCKEIANWNMKSTKKIPYEFARYLEQLKGAENE